MITRGAATIAPAPAGYQPPSLPGTAPGPAAGITRARLVIVSGPAGAVLGVFVYAPGTTPALGNPPITWESSASQDPFGNPLPSTTGIAGTGTFSAGNVITTIQGTVAYSVLPVAANNMLNSQAPVAFTDAAGNAVLGGTTTYGKVGATYYALNELPGIDASGTFGAVTTVYTAASQAGPWTAGGQINLAGGNLMSLLADGVRVFGISGQPSIQLHNGTGLLSPAATLTGTGAGALNITNTTGYAADAVVGTIDTTTITPSAGNTSFQALSNVWNIPANDGQTGIGYRLTAAGSGTWGATPQQLLFIVSGMGTTMGQLTFGSTVFPASTAFAWKTVCEVVLASSTVARCTIHVTLTVNNGNAVIVANNAANTTIAGTSWQSPVTVTTNVNTNLTLQSKWGGAFGNIASAYSIFERIGLWSTIRATTPRARRPRA